MKCLIWIEEKILNWLFQRRKMRVMIEIREHLRAKLVEAFPNLEQPDAVYKIQ